MKRDMDLIRNFLIQIEDGKSEFDFMTKEMAEILGTSTENEISQETAAHEIYNFELLLDADLIEGDRSGCDSFYVTKITWAGHDFLDTIRDEKTWVKTKQGALAAGGWTLDILKDLAKGFIKKQIEEQTGIKL